MSRLHPLCLFSEVASRLSSSDVPSHDCYCSICSACVATVVIFIHLNRFCTYLLTYLLKVPERVTYKLGYSRCAHVPIYNQVTSLPQIDASLKEREGREGRVWKERKEKRMVKLREWRHGCWKDRRPWDQASRYLMDHAARQFLKLF